MNEPDFWSDKKTSEGIIKEANELKSILSEFDNLKNSVQNNIETLNLLKEDFDLEFFNLIEKEVNPTNNLLENLETKLLLNKEFDKEDAILEIHSGAGGTEACDWANMLYRMYLRYIENKGFKAEIIEEQPGEEVGIKGATIIVKGTNAFGYLKEERGVHRLVRISPFDSNSRRHTSFASIDIIPKMEKNFDIEIKESDLRIDVYRSSGAGGQSVNTTDSAVRITHLPTKTVVTCQNERSQIQNKEKALEILKNKLYKLEQERKQEQLNQLKGSPMDINFGSQIRSYVMHPYSMVKDHRTNKETSSVSKVLDGDLDLFINASLRREE